MVSVPEIGPQLHAAGGRLAGELDARGVPLSRPLSASPERRWLRGRIDRGDAVAVHRCRSSSFTQDHRGITVTRTAARRSSPPCPRSRPSGG
jgi:hypothetical protein